jgi:hypothetical protein
MPGGIGGDEVAVLGSNGRPVSIRATCSASFVTVGESNTDGESGGGGWGTLRDAGGVGWACAALTTEESCARLAAAIEALPEAAPGIRRPVAPLAGDRGAGGGGDGIKTSGNALWPVAL